MSSSSSSSSASARLMARAKSVEIAPRRAGGPSLQAAGGDCEMPLTQSSCGRDRNWPSASLSAAASGAGSVHSVLRKRGYTVRRGSSVWLASLVRASSTSSSGHGASGFTWSGVTGETPPQSLMPASSRRGKSACARFGGACRLTSSGRIRRAIASVHRCSSSDGSGASTILVPALARKFWTITSCRCPCSACSSRSASSASTCSRRVSPMPIRMPDVVGILCAPIRRSVSRRTEGSLSGEP